MKKQAELRQSKRETLQNIPSLTDSGSLEVSLNKREGTATFGQPELIKRISSGSANISFPSTNEAPIGNTLPSSLQNNFEQNKTLSKIDLSKPLDVIDESREEQHVQNPAGSNASLNQKFPSSGSSDVNNSQNKRTSQQALQFQNNSQKQSSFSSNYQFGIQTIPVKDKEESMNSNHLSASEDKKRSLNMGSGGSFSNYNIEAACQIKNQHSFGQQNSVPNTSSFGQNSSSFGKGYSFGIAQQQAKEESKSQSQSIEYQIQPQMSQQNIFNQNQQQSVFGKQSSFRTNYSLKVIPEESGASKDLGQSNKCSTIQSIPSQSLSSRLFSNQVSPQVAENFSNNLSPQIIDQSSAMIKPILEEQGIQRQPNTQREIIEEQSDLDTASKYAMHSNLQSAKSAFTKINHDSQFSGNKGRQSRFKRGKIRSDSLAGLDLPVSKLHKLCDRGLQTGNGLDFGVRQDLSCTIGPGGIPALDQMEPANDLLSSTFKEIDILGDLSTMNINAQQNDILNQSYTNLLSFSGGRAFAKNQNFQRQRLNSVSVSFGDQQNLVSSQNQMIMAGTKPLPRIGGMGDGGRTRLTNAALNQQLEKVSSQVSGIPGFQQPLTPQQLQIIQMHELQMMKKKHDRINASEKFLAKLRTHKSFERPKMSVEKRLSRWDQDMILYDPALQQQEVNSTSIFSNSQMLDQISGNDNQCQVYNNKEVMIRQKSESQLNFSGFVSFTKLKGIFRREMLISTSELLQIRINISELQRGVPKVNYYFIIFQDIKHLIDLFVDQSIEQFLELKYYWMVYYKFDQLKNDIHKKIQMAKLRDNSNDTSNNNKSADASATTAAEGYLGFAYSLSTIEISNLEKVLRNIRYILTKLGRTINYLEALKDGFMKYQLKLDILKNTIAPSKTKLAPNLKHIIEQQRGFESLNLTYQAPSQFKMNDLDKTYQPNKKQISWKTWVPDEKKIFKSKVLCTNNEIKLGKAQSKFQTVNIQKLLIEFPLEERFRIILNQNKMMAKQWKEEYDKKRMIDVPTIVCRICNKEIFADVSERHNKACLARNMKSKSQKELNTQFLNLQSRATEIMRLLESSIRNIPRTQNMFQAPNLGNITNSIRDRKFRAFSIAGIGGPGMNLLSQDLRMGKKQKQLNPVTNNKSEEINQNQDQQMNTQNPKPLIPALNFSKLNNQESNTSVIQNLEVIDEREEKQEKKTGTEFTDRNISSQFKQQATQEMVDIAKIQFITGHLPQRKPPKSSIFEQKFILKLKTDIQKITDFKSEYLEADNKSAKHNAQVQLSNKARDISFDSLSQKNYSARTVLQKSLRSTERAELRRTKRERQTHNTNEIIDLSEGRLKYRFIKDPKIRNQKAANQKEKSIKTQDEKSPKYYVPKKKRSSVKVNNFMSQFAQTQNTDNRSENKSQSKSHSASQKQQTTKNHQIRTAAKQQLDIIEQLEANSLTCYEMSEFNMAYKRQLAIFKQNSSDITLLQQRKQSIEMPEVVFQYLIDFEYFLKRKIKALEELSVIEDDYMKTLPSKEVENIKRSLQQFQPTFEKFQHQANQLKILQINLTNVSHQNSSMQDNSIENGINSNQNQIQNFKSLRSQRRLSLAAPVIGSHKLLQKLVDVQSQSPDQRRGSLFPYSQFSLLGSNLDKLEFENQRAHLNSTFSNEQRFQTSSKALIEDEQVIQNSMLTYSGERQRGNASDQAHLRYDSTHLSNNNTPQQFKEQINFSQNNINFNNKFQPFASSLHSKEDQERDIENLPLVKVITAQFSVGDDSLNQNQQIQNNKDSQTERLSQKLLKREQSRTNAVKSYEKSTFKKQNQESSDELSDAKSSSESLRDFKPLHKKFLPTSLLRTS